MESNLVILISIQMMFLPIYGLIWLGIRNERKKYKRLLSFAIVAASRRR